MSTTTVRHPAGFAAATRINSSLTATAEKRLLLWLAERTPARVSSDQLTVLGLCAQFGAGAAYALVRFDRRFLLAAIACLVLNWVGDSLDGTLARVRNQQRPRFGFYVDHVVDVIGATALMGGLAVSGIVHADMAIAMLIAFLLLAAESYLATYTLSRFHLSQGLFGPTEIRLLLIAGNLAVLRSPYATVFRHRMLLFDLGGAIALLCMTLTGLITVLRHTRELYREEPLP